MHGRSYKDYLKLFKHKILRASPRCNQLVYSNVFSEPIPADLAKSSGYVNIDDLVTTEQLITCKPVEV